MLTIMIDLLSRFIWNSELTLNKGAVGYGLYKIVVRVQRRVPRASTEA